MIFFSDDWRMHAYLVQSVWYVYVYFEHRLCIYYARLV